MAGGGVDGMSSLRAWRLSAAGLGWSESDRRHPDRAARARFCGGTGATCGRMSPAPLARAKQGRMEPHYDPMATAERILYVEALWDRIAADAERELLTPALATELERRLADWRAHPGDSVSWEVALAQLRS
jgi:putative addiction module component (TIGR02574 family)